ncbi:MRP1-like protein [Mya arenaria]|uniref:MRP1-like protein n=1 Tax=Mya arenaria TaxID=6604 RepID=A0ABY7EIG6_MYAAR|nr:MRP1-like protein [Mya arenaria]
MDKFCGGEQLWVLGILQIIIIVIELVYGASELNRKHETYFQAYFLGPFIEGLSLILVLVYIELERRKGQISSGIISVYWTLANITYIIPFYKKLFEKKPCQESRVSFFSRIYFQWIQSLVVAGYKKPLVEDDMFTLNTEDQSANVIKPFEKIWKEEKTKFLLKKRPKSAGFIVVIILQSLFFHNMTHKTMTLGIRSLTTNNQARTESTTGEIVNLMSVDAEHVKDLCGYIWGIWSCPLQIILSLIFLYFTVGYSMFAGLGVMVLLVPLNWFITTKLQDFEVIRMGDSFWRESNKDKRKGIKRFVKTATDVGLATFATYIFTKDDHRFDPQTAFVAMTLFNILRFGLNVAPMIVMELIKSTVSIKRIQHYLNSNDIDTTCVQHGSLAYVSQQAWIQNASVKDNILFGNALDETRYDKVVESCSLKSDLDILPAGDDTEIGEKGINLSGGQKQRVSVARAVYFDNDIYILDDPLSAVDSHVGKHIFENVVGKDGLLKEKTRILVTHGIHWLPSVDRIIVLTQGRISEVGSYDQLIEHDGAFASFLRTYLTEHAESDSESEDEEVHDFKVTMLQRLLSIHSDDDVPPKPVIKRSKSQRTSESVATLKNTEASTGSEVKNGLGDKAKLIDEEEVEVGNVKWGVYAQYARAIGLKYTFVIIGMYCVYEGLSIFASVWLSNWTSDPDLQDVEHYPPDSEARRELNDYYLSIYGELGIAQGIAVFSYAIIQAFRAVRASKHLHRNMLMSVLRAPMSFFDTTPVGRIVNRFSQDVDAIDETLPEMFVEVLFSVFNVASVIIIISYSTPIFLSIIIPIAFLYTLLQVM